MKATQKQHDNKGGGGHEADHFFGIVYSVNDRGVVAPVDLCPGTGRVNPESCCSALVGKLDREMRSDHGGMPMIGTSSLLLWFSNGEL